MTKSLEAAQEEFNMTNTERREEMANFEFGGMLYRNSREMHIAIAEEWLSAGGRNHRDDMLHDLSLMSDSCLADEAIADWDANGQPCWDANGQPWEPEAPSFDRDELIDAFRSLRANFDEHFPDEINAAGIRHANDDQRR